jgi:hypothetical protein
MCLAFNSFGQNRFVAGIKAGLSTSQVDGDSYSGYNKAGLIGGIFVTGKINEKWSSQFEMIFIQKGAKHNSNPDKGDLTYYYLGLNYIEVPLLFQYHQKKFTFEVGPSFGYLISNKEYNEYGEVYKPLPFNSYEIGGGFGISYTLIQNLTMNWRYSYSLRPIRDFQLGNTYWRNPGQWNNVLSFTLNYTFRKKDAKAE